MDELIEKAIVVAVKLQKDEHFEYGLEELHNLAHALNVEVVGEITQNLTKLLLPIMLEQEK